MAYLGALLAADMRNNSLGCTAFTEVNSNHTSYNQSTGKAVSCGATQLLPCFLELTDFTVPRSDSSNMACPEIRRKPHSQGVADCGDETQLVSYCGAAVVQPATGSHRVAMVAAHCW